MKINWRVRVRSGAFWLGAASSFLVFLQAFFGLLGLQLPFAQGDAMHAATLLLAFLAAVGVVNDPTTPGVADSARALLYTEPGGAGAPEGDAPKGRGPA